ncbi:MAG: ABC transporter ATP-binding protein, partial [Candidatus Omnitrophica bacterium]|nr:ABC transporter ATP-binding protein [Candidatus Omnitrophota bacterium]
AADHIIETGSVEFRDVSFGYRKDASVIDGISFLVEPYSKAAFVGLSGSGKTTMISLISRLYEPGEGGIYIDGVDIKKIKLASLKSQTSIALQQSYLWNDTIANNILYGAGGSTRQDMIEAAKLAEAHEFIIRSRDGYDSNVGEAGHSLSEGQKQRIAIARAFISKPRLLVLDEAMSSLDSETEDKIIDNIKREFKDSTVIIVSHRLSTVEKMDMVYFLKDSSTMESGTHEELVRKNLRYGELFASQFKDTLSEEPAVFQ